MDIKRLLALSGAAFVVVVLVVVIGFSGSTPGTDDSGAEIASYYDKHEVRQAIAAFLLAATVPLLVVFASVLADTADAATASLPTRAWRKLLVGGSLILGAVIVGTALIHFALADGADNVSPGGLEALNMLDNSFWVAANPALGVMMLGAAGVILDRTQLARWLGWAALLLGVALFIPYADFFALLLSLLWIIVVSVMLYISADTQHRSRP